MATKSKTSNQGSTQQLALTAGTDVASPSEAPREGLLATNHLNLLFMLSIGMVPAPGGFGKKYYRDPLGTYPGWVPLFTRKVFGPAIELAKEEADDLSLLSKLLQIIAWTYSCRYFALVLVF